MEPQTTLFQDIAKLATKFVPGRRQDVDALLTLGRIAGTGAQTLAGKQVETLRALGEDLRAALTGQSEDDISKTEAVREAMRKAIGGYAELAEAAVDAQSEAFDTVKQRAHANLEELKSLLSRTK